METHKEELKNYIYMLLNNKKLIRRVYEYLAVDNIGKSIEYIWTFLLFGGYLTIEKMEMKDGIEECHFKIPNLEIKKIWNLGDNRNIEF